ncbi:DUF1365 domain-containing protein [Burkholderia sp. L27(2015)]|uniref:DUF1365 domain-containing protein n=1 Tax=Burkholderia sp. L27(2015) TaxID=1641858 RepID=UPI00131E3DFE|nr:DUF1365 domain-containing protein [Burkholderia sp. L27(2015)]
MNTAVTRPAALLLLGKVVHERLRPVRHRFVYPVFCVRCDLARLAELDSWWLGVNRWAPLSLYARDYGPRDGTDLDAWMRAQLSDAALPADGEIWLQTFPRVFGYAFNPVSFWLCHDRAGHLRALLAEVRNTFGARHAYLLSANDRGVIDARTVLVCRKVLDVSPFCRVEGHYAFRVRDSRRAQAQRTVSTAIDYHDAQGLLIRTVIAARTVPLTCASGLRALARQPWLTFAVVMHIHWQALRLWVKKVPFHGKCPAPRTGDGMPETTDAIAASNQQDSRHASHSLSKETQP